MALPVAAEEGFTGLVDSSRNGKAEMPAVAQGLEEYDQDELLKVDGEGRCIITDHGHFGTAAFSLVEIFNFSMDNFVIKKCFWGIWQCFSIYMGLEQKVTIPRGYSLSSCSSRYYR